MIALRSGVIIAQTLLIAAVGIAIKDLNLHGYMVFAAVVKFVARKKQQVVKFNSMPVYDSKFCMSLLH